MGISDFLPPSSLEGSVSNVQIPSKMLVLFIPALMDHQALACRSVAEYPLTSLY